MASKLPPLPNIDKKSMPANTITNKAKSTDMKKSQSTQETSKQINKADSKTIKSSIDKSNAKTVTNQQQQQKIKPKKVK